MYNKSLIKNSHKIKNIKMLTQANSTLGKQAKKPNATATNLSSSSASSSMLSSLIFAMTLLPAHHRHHQQQQLPKQKQHKFQRHPQTRLSFLSCSNFLLTLIFPLILFCLQCPSVLAGSCREAQLCCNGRDSSCVVQKAPINAIIEDLSDKPCYCDHACLKLGDCCSDFKDHCGVLDCQVSDWGQWSDCSTACGSGIMTRTRQVLQAAQNGGKHCPVLIQKRGCQGFRCHGHHDKKILRETALLLPASLTHKHHANDSSVRRNLRNHYRETYQHNREQEYCVEFEVLRTSKSCHKLPPYNLLIEGDRIVVRCDVEAFIQDFAGSSDNNDLTSSTLKSKHHNDTAYYNKLDLIDSSAEEDLNDSDENMIDNSSSSSSSSDEHDDYDTASLTVKTTTSTTTTTTTTTTTPYPPPQPIQYHCRGEGLPGRTTRWSALAAPSCRGKWLRLTLDTPKKCSHAQFIFV